MGDWAGDKPRLLLLNQHDRISAADKQKWASHFHTLGTRVFWTNGKSGEGVAKVGLSLCSNGKCCSGDVGHWVLGIVSSRVVCELPATGEMGKDLSKRSWRVELCVH